MTGAPQLSTTSYALLGQLALRPWSSYEMTQNVKRTLHWFWPRAESVIYQEMKRLADAGLATSTTSAGARGRPRQTYALTAAGRHALAEWLASRRVAPTLTHSEALLRVHLAPFGTRDELLATLEAARSEGVALVAQALVIGGEFASGSHQFQDQVHVRAILFDYLWAHGLGLADWATRSIEVVSAWTDLEPTLANTERGRERIAALIEQAPLRPG
jgi:DNA-binding PadR family transcriptional regulator